MPALATFNQAFSDVNNARELRVWRNGFNPVNFAKSPDNIRAECEAKAKEIHEVVDRMFQKAPSTGQGKGKNHQQASRSRNGWVSKC